MRGMIIVFNEFSYNEICLNLLWCVENAEGENASWRNFRQKNAVKRVENTIFFSDA